MKDSTTRVLQALTLFCIAVIGLFLNVIVSLVFYKRPALRSSSNRANQAIFVGMATRGTDGEPTQPVYFHSTSISSFFWACLSESCIITLYYNYLECFVNKIFVIINALVSLLFTIFVSSFRRETFLKHEWEDPDNAEEETEQFVLSLVVANIISVLGLVPTVLYIFVRNTFDCLAHFGSFLLVLVVTASIFSILIIAIDRYNAVLSPLHYSMTITSQRNKETIAAIWCMSFLLSIPPLLSVINKRLLHAENEVLRFSYVIIFFTFGFVIPLLTLIWVYTRMYIAAHKNSERTRRQSIQANVGDCSRGGSVETQYPPIITTLDFIRTAKPPMLSQMHKRRCSNASFSAILFREEGRAVKTAVMVVASFIFCWGPFFVVLLLLTFEILETLTYTVVFSGTLTIVLNSILSPFIYVFRNEIARNEAVRLLFWWKKVGLYEGNVLHEANKELKMKMSDGRIRIRHQSSSSNYDSMSVQSFQLPINYSIDCKQCTEPTHPPVADFVATYEVVNMKNELKNNSNIKPAENKTRGESVTFRLAFLPQRRCQTCIRQNSDSSSGSAHPLLKETESPTPVHSIRRHETACRVNSADDFSSPRGRFCDSPKQISLKYDKDQTIAELEEQPNSEAVKFQEPKTEIPKESCLTYNKEQAEIKRDPVKQDSKATINSSPMTMTPMGSIPKRHRYKLQRLSAVEDEDSLYKNKVLKFPPCDFG